MRKTALYNLLNSTVKYLIHLLVLSVYKKKCQICSEHITDYELTLLCKKCRTAIEKRGKYHCSKCSTSTTVRTLLCGQCTLKVPPYSQHLSYGVYQGKMRKLILLFKLSEIEPLKKYIAGLYLYLYDINAIGKCDIVMAVPSDPDRQKKFYPLNVIAEIIAKERKMKLSVGNLVKTKHTVKQTSLNYKKRMKNLNRAFKIYNSEEIEGKKILLLDDVYTTGTTVKKCSALLNKYAKEVIVITMAKSPKVL